MKLRKGLLALLVLILLITTLTAEIKVKTAKDFIADAKAVVKEISVEEAFKIYKSKDSKYIFLDVREANEVEAGHIPNAHWIPRGLLEFKIASLVKNTEDKIIVVYCKSGGRSILAAKTLKEMGYNVLSVSGGFTAWKNKRYPIRRGLPGTTGGGCS